MLFLKDLWQTTKGSALKIKIFLYTFPLFFLAVFVASFIFEGFQPHMKVNQLIISSAADATFLNPVLAQDAASSDINSFIFNGLIRFHRIYRTDHF